MRSIRKTEVSELVWRCAMCNRSHREYVRDLDYFRKDGDRELSEAGWTQVPTDPAAWPPDVTDDTSLFFCPDHAEAARLMRLSVAVFIPSAVSLEDDSAERPRALFGRAAGATTSRRTP